MTSKLIVGGFIAAAWLCVPLRAQGPPPRALEAIREAQNPVVFVHGFCSGNDTWQATQEELQRRGWKFGGALTDPVLPVFSSEANADYYLVQFSDPLIQTGIQASWSIELALYLRRIAAHRRANGLGQPRFTLVAHSAGGLASRAYLQSSVYTDDVWHLITYGTPHLGTPLANLRLLAELAPGRCRDLPAFAVSQGVQEMDPDSQFLRTLNERPSPRDCAASTTIAGRRQLFLPAKG